MIILAVYKITIIRLKKHKLRGSYYITDAKSTKPCVTL
jgi:hypothetical protein